MNRRFCVTVRARLSSVFRTVRRYQLLRMVVVEVVVGRVAGSVASMARWGAKLWRKIELSLSRIKVFEKWNLRRIF